MILSGISGELPSKIARSKDFLNARAAVNRWVAAQDLAHQALRLYHDPNVRALVGNDDAMMQHLWNNPNRAMKLLVEASVKDPKAFHAPAAQETAPAGDRGDGPPVMLMVS